jgi:diguanylate cyclase (GGDEF)-like protein
LFRRRESAHFRGSLGIATILIVDDLSANRKSLVRLLGRERHRLLEASDGSEGLAAVRAEHPDLVITDVLMPVMDGFEFVRQLRLDPTTSGVRVVFYTAHYDAREARARALSSGVSDVITKPAESAEVLEIVGRVLSGAPDLKLPSDASPLAREFDREHLPLITDTLSENVGDLRTANARLRALINIGLEFATEGDTDRRLQILCTSACDLFGATYGSLGIVDRTDRRVQRLVTCGVDAARWIEVGDAVSGILWTVIAERRTLRGDNPSGDPASLKLPLLHPAVQAYLVAPIASPAHVYGWMCLVGNEGRTFSEDDEQLVMALAGQAGRMYELDREILERKQAESALRSQGSAMARQARALTCALDEREAALEAKGALSRQMSNLAKHDVLTTLPNRLLLHDRLTRAIELASRNKRRLAVLFLDVDRFKHINDLLGHGIGDQVLRSVADRLATCVRSSDTVSRHGGDEFVVLLAELEHAADAAASATKIIAAVSAPIHIAGHEIHLTISVGISVYPDDGSNAEVLAKSADIAMYHAKARGSNGYQFFKADMNVGVAEREFVEKGLRRSLERQEFVLHYQPMVNLETGDLTAVEALIRWRHPDRGLIAPAHFVRIAEECGLIVPIGQWVLREACRQVKAWQQAGLPPISVSVNISAIEFESRTFLEDVRRILEETRLEARYLELELTENVLMPHAESSIATLQALKTLGVGLAIDDFGTGYSSLSYLTQLPIDVLKVDQSFVHELTSDPDGSCTTGAALIVNAVIGMGKSLRHRVIAEGVETPEQLACLQEQHCDEGQGYYFSRPLVAEQFAKVLKAGKTAPFH